MLRLKNNLSGEPLSGSELGAKICFFFSAAGKKFLVICKVFLGFVIVFLR